MACFALDLSIPSFVLEMPDFLHTVLVSYATRYTVICFGTWSILSSYSVYNVTKIGEVWKVEETNPGILVSGGHTEVDTVQF